MTQLEAHAKSLAKSTALSRYYYHMAREIPPAEVIRILNDAKVSFVLAGAHALAGWTKKPRATEDVDVVVATRHLKKAVRALLAAYPDLEPRDFEVVTRFVDRHSQEVAIDVMKPNQQLFRVIFKNAVKITSQGQTYRIPTLEMALAMKFAAMVSPHRKDSLKYKDAHDFMTMVEASPDINLTKLAELGDLVYPGGGKEIVELVRRTRAGEHLDL